MILIDTSALVALFNSKDKFHRQCVNFLEQNEQPFYTTTPVLTESFHMLGPSSVNADFLKKFILNRGMKLWFMDEKTVDRAIDLMQRYQDYPMDFADASLVIAAENLKISQIFTLDRNDFETYRVRVGHEYRSFEIML